MPRAQAEVVARGVTTMFVHNFDALVTKDFLDTRFREFETRVEMTMDKRFLEVQRRFDSLEDRLEVRFERTGTGPSWRLSTLNQLGPLREGMLSGVGFLADAARVGAQFGV